MANGVLRTEADVPPLPPMLRKDASESEKAQRLALVRKRQQMQKALHEQRRGSRNRRDRARPASESVANINRNARRAAVHLFNKARHHSLPRITPGTYSELVALTTDVLAVEEEHGVCSQAKHRAAEPLRHAWERVMQRQPSSVSLFELSEEGDPCLRQNDRITCLESHGVDEAPEQFMLIDGMDGDYSRGAVYHFEGTHLTKIVIGVWGSNRKQEVEPCLYHCQCSNLNEPMTDCHAFTYHRCGETQWCSSECGAEVCEEQSWLLK